MVAMSGERWWVSEGESVTSRARASAIIPFHRSSAAAAPHNLLDLLLLEDSLPICTSMGDVAQILGIPTQPPRTLLQNASLPDTLPPAAPTVAGGSTKDSEKRPGFVKVGSKWIDSKKPARPWVWAPFSSSSRTDGALFNHWVRANVEYPDYPFARFDVHLDAVTYNEDEYQKLLKDDSWTKGETDALMELARRFELRWPVVHDRWTISKRSIQELQHRYYSVASILNQARVALEADLAGSTDTTDETRLLEAAAARALAADPAQQPMVHLTGSGTTNKPVFDLEAENQRRAHWQAVWDRTKEEENEEANLRQELKQVEAQLRKFKKQGKHKKPVANNSLADLKADKLDSLWTTPVPEYPYWQSARLAPPPGLGTDITAQLDSLLQDLKVVRPTVPTKRVVDLYDQVRKDALTLLVLQRDLAQKQAMLQAKRLGRNTEESLLGIAPPAPAPKPAPASKPAESAAAAPNAMNTAVTSGKGKAARKQAPKRKRSTTPKKKKT